MVMDSKNKKPKGRPKLIKPEGHELEYTGVYLPKYARDKIRSEHGDISKFVRETVVEKLKTEKGG